MGNVSYEEFSKMDLRIGKILEVEEKHIQKYGKRKTKRNTRTS